MRKLKKLAPSSSLRLLSFRGTLQRLSVALITLVMTLTAQTAWAEVVDETEVSSWAELKSVSTVNGSTVTLTKCIKTAAVLTIEEPVTLDLNGYGIRSTAREGAFIYIGDGGNLTLKDDAAVKPTRYITVSGSRGTAVSTSVPGGNYLTVTGGYITGALKAYGVTNDGKFTMAGGTLCGNALGGILVYSTTALAGGTITGNYGHSVYINGANAVLKMTGGSITGNNILYLNGGGVAVNSGKFIMTGGSITDNTVDSSHNGGGVYVNNGTCIIAGGTVSGNTAGSGVDNNIYSANSTDVYILSGCVDGGIGQSSSEYAPTQFSFGTGTDGSDAKPFVISDAAGWNVFCELISNGIYRDKHYELGHDISVTQMAGGKKSTQTFTGTFDGKSHTLEFNASASEDKTAPFRGVAGATIRNLHVTGTITTSYSHAAGIVYLVSYPGLTIENCRSSVTINSTYKGAGYHGGILSGVATVSDATTVNITGCVFDGKIITGSTNAKKTTNCGGFVGRNQGSVNITNCLYAPAALAEDEKAASKKAASNSYAFVLNDGGSSTITRSYYTEEFGTAQGIAQRSITAGDEYVTVAAVNPVGSATATYTTSGITAYAKCIKRNGTFYYGNGDDVSLTLSHSNRTGYFFSGYSPSAGTLNGTTLTMPNANVTISAEWADPDDISVNAAGTEYTIKTAKGWNAFCYLLDDNTKGYFTSKTVKLNDNIGTAQNPVTRMAGSSSKPFTGTFNGQGNTLTVNYTGTSYVAPFPYVDGATIQNLRVEGSIISSGTRAAGVIGETGSPGKSGTATSHITNCVSSSTIRGGNYTGGFSIGGNVEIEGCVFNGKINGSGCRAGFVGYSQSTLKITNCLFAPQSGSTISEGTFYYKGAADITPVNSYYTQALGKAQGKQAYEVSAAPERLCNGTGEDIVKTYSNNDLNYGLGFDNKYYLGIIPLSDSETEGVSYLTTNLQGETVPVEFKRTFSAGKASTICLPFAMNTISGGKVYRFAGITHDSTNGWVATMSDATPDGNNVTATEANKPYVFMPDADGVVTFSGTTDEIPASLTAGSTASGDWTFKGTYTKLIYGTTALNGYVYGFASKTKYVDGEGEVQAGEFVHAKDGASVPPMRCYLTYKNGSQFAGTRGMTRGDDDDMPQTITVRFIGANGEVTAIGTMNTQTGEITTDGWYTLSGTKLAGKPTKKGLYIHDGKKTVIR